MKKQIFLFTFSFFLFPFSFFGQGMTQVKSKPNFTNLDIIIADNSSRSLLSVGQKDKISDIGTTILQKQQNKFLYYCCNLDKPIIATSIRSREDAFKQLYDQGKGEPFDFRNDRALILSSLEDSAFTASSINIYVFLGSAGWERLEKTDPIELSGLLNNLPLQILTLYGTSEFIPVSIHIYTPASLADADVQVLKNLNTLIFKNTYNNTNISYDLQTTP